MPVSKSYTRPKSTVVNTTAIVFSIFASEKPDAPADISGTGNTGQLHALFKADADESGSADVQNLFRLETDMTLANTPDARPILTVTVTPITGAGVDGTAKSLPVEHPETMDAWQTGAGRARQA